MRKLFLTMLVFGLVLGLAAKQATCAGTLTVTDTSIVTATEGIGQTSGANFDLDTDVATPLNTASIGTGIHYKPGVFIPNNDFIEFKFTNCDLRSSKFVLAVDEAQAGVDADGDGSMRNDLAIVSSAFSVLDSANGVTSVKVRVAAKTGILADWECYLLGDDSTLSSDVATTFTSANDDGMELRLDSGLSNNAKVTVSATVTTAQGASFAAGDAKAVTFITVKDQFSFSFDVGTSIIDVEATTPRALFEDELNPDQAELVANDDSDLNASSGAVELDNDSGTAVTDFIVLGAGDQLEVTLGDSNNVTAGLNFTGSDVFVSTDNIQTANANQSDFGSTTLLAVVALAKLPTHGNAFKDDVLIGVDGTTTLSTQIWPLDVLLDFNDTDFTDVSSTHTDFITWTINGYQGVIPWLDTRSTVPMYCLVNNTTDAAATIFLDVLSYDTNPGGAVADTYQGLNIGSVPQEASSLLKFVGETVSLEGTDTVLDFGGVNTRYSAMLTATAAAGGVHINCNQTDPHGSKRMTPVFTGSNSRHQ